MFAQFSYPSRLKSDNVAEDFSNFLKEYVVYITSSPLWSRVNGKVERQNRSILKRLKIAILEKKNIEIELSKHSLFYHSTPHSSTGVSTVELMFQCHIRDKLFSITHLSPLYEVVKDKDVETNATGKMFAEKREKVSP